MWAKQNRVGFTIVELLIVIVVIAILAAITIVAFNGIQQRARQSAANAAAAQAAKKLSLYQADGSVFPLTGELSAAGISASGDTSYQYASNGLTYCLSVINTGATANVSNSNTAPGAGMCSGQSSAQLANGSFENPVTAGFLYRPAGGSWNFTSNSGVQRNGSGFGATLAPDGVQGGLLQGVGGGNGKIDQSVTFAYAGSYRLTFKLVRRNNEVQPITVSIDGSALGTYTAANGYTYESLNTPYVTIGSGLHTISFAATIAGGDATAFIDDIKLEQQ